MDGLRSFGDRLFSCRAAAWAGGVLRGAVVSGGRGVRSRAAHVGSVRFRKPWHVPRVLCGSWGPCVFRRLGAVLEVFVFKGAGVRYGADPCGVPYGFGPFRAENETALRNRSGGRSFAERAVCHCCEAVYSSAILRTAAARFSLSGCEENIFCTVDALAPCDSSTSFSSDAAMP